MQQEVPEEAQHVQLTISLSAKKGTWLLVRGENVTSVLPWPIGSTSRVVWPESLPFIGPPPARMRPSKSRYIGKPAFGSVKINTKDSITKKHAKTKLPPSEIGTLKEKRKPKKDPSVTRSSAEERQKARETLIEALEIVGPSTPIELLKVLGIEHTDENLRNLGLELANMERQGLIASDVIGGGKFRRKLRYKVLESKE